MSSAMGDSSTPGDGCALGDGSSLGDSSRSKPALADRLAHTADAIESLLEGLLGPEPLPGEITRPPILLAAMRHGTLGGGKRLRPFLVVETAGLFAVDPHQALRAGAAVELVHCYSLVHDDLPAMDDDDLRRGRPTVHRAYDEATAILAGDSLLTLAFDVMADPATHESGDIRAALVLALARASGLGGMAGGQMIDLQAEGRFEGGVPQRLQPDAIRRLQAMKTGALLAGSVEVGGILGKANPAERAALLAYGKALGAAFQVADDILDVEATQEEMGKATAKDQGRGKATLVSALGLEEAKRERDALSRQAIDSLACFGRQADILREAALFVAARRS